MSTHHICFYGELMKIILQVSSNTLLIYSTEYRMQLFKKIHHPWRFMFIPMNTLGVLQFKLRSLKQNWGKIKEVWAFLSINFSILFSIKKWEGPFIREGAFIRIQYDHKLLVDINKGEPCQANLCLQAFRHDKF